jgi:SpoVK/Ycf46/Vps4 family AAA+-type ATPase
MFPLFAFRTGMLLYGPPGTGKTLMAKAIATECRVNFMSVKGPELLNMYVGESERNVRALFSKARAAAPCVVFFDEIDSIAGRSGSSTDGGGVIDRVMAQLLAELDTVNTEPSSASAPEAPPCADLGADGTQSTCNITEDDWARLLETRPKLVFFVGATNRPDLLDPALLRPGRLDQLVYLGVSPDPSAKLAVLQALTRKYNLAPDVNLEALAAVCPPSATGADLSALTSGAMTKAVKRCIRNSAGTDAGVSSDIRDGTRTGPQVRQADFTDTLSSFRTSVSPEELAQYDMLRNSFEGGKTQ